MAGRAPFNVTAAKTAAANSSGLSGRSSSSTPHSPWHSPVPYLFGGLAAMLGLIAFALLILACSYWKLSGYLQENGEGDEGEGRDLEAGEGGEANQKPPPVMEQKFLVIMAGEVKPTFLATPISSSSSSNNTSRSSSFGDNSSEKSCCCEKGDEKSEENGGDGEVVQGGSRSTSTSTSTMSSSSSSTHQASSESTGESGVGEERR